MPDKYIEMSGERGKVGSMGSPRMAGSVCGTKRGLCDSHSLFDISLC